MTKIDPDPRNFACWSFNSQVARGRSALQKNEKIRSRFLHSLREQDSQEEMNFSFARIRLALVYLGEILSESLLAKERRFNFLVIFSSLAELTKRVRNALNALGSSY
jgi:hypothetical protein